MGSVVGRVAALRFYFVRTLRRLEFREELPYPKDSKDRRRLPTVLSLDEVARLINHSLLRRFFEYWPAGKSSSCTGRCQISF